MFPSHVFVRLRSRRGFGPMLAAVLMLAAVRVLAAADAGPAPTPEIPVVPPPAPVEPPAPPVPVEQLLPAPGVLAASPVRPLAASRTPWQWGPVSVRPHLSYRGLHGDGIQSRPGQPATTTIETFSPGVQFDAGPRWVADYTLARTLYSNPEFADTVDHAAFIAGTVGREDWKIALRQSYNSTTAPLIETGQPTKQDVAATSIRSDTELGRQLSAEVDLGYTAQFVRAFSDSREWSGGAWLHYAFPLQIDGAAGLGAGRVDVSRGSDMNYTRAEARLASRIGTKLDLELQGGVEHRQFTQAGQRSRNNPTLRASVRYTPVEPTVLAFAATREVATSYFADQFVENSRLGADLEQRFFGHFYLAAAWVWQKARYVGSGVGIATAREDESHSLNLRLQSAILRRGTVAVFYQRTRNASNQPGFSFTSNQVGLEIGFRF